MPLKPAYHSIFKFSRNLTLPTLALWVMLSLTTTGCLLSYLVSSGYQQMRILWNREPIEKVLAQNDLEPKQRHKLELALDVQRFVENDLKLAVSHSYRTFVDIKRPYVTYIVTVAEKFKLKSKLYWYPVVGKLPYKGYFEKKDAESEAKSFDPQKYDVMVRGVTAYSTLGWFDDPLLSTMIDGDDHDLVNLIIHESTHASLYIKSQADFNEQLATFFGDIGTETYYKKKEGENSKTLKSIAFESQDQKLFSNFISEEIRKLSDWYETEMDITEDSRQARFEEIKNEFKMNVAPQLKTSNYLKFGEAKLNNAILLYYKTYMYNLSDLQNLYEKFEYNFEKFFEFCKSLEKSKDPAQDIKIKLSQI